LGYARVWDTATWREDATLRGFLNAVNSVAFSPDAGRIATGGSNPDDAVKLWDVDSWQELLTLEGAGSLFDLISFSPDGNAIGTLVGGNQRGRSEGPSFARLRRPGKSGDQAAVSAHREELPFNFLRHVSSKSPRLQKNN
jgi:WD40 repeat protein